MSERGDEGPADENPPPRPASTAASPEESSATDTAADETAAGDPGGGTAASSVIDTGPRKLHPLTVAYQLGSTAIRVGVIAIFAGVGGITALLDSGRLVVVAAVVVGILALAGVIVGYAVLSYQRFDYRLGTETFDIREGVLSRREREIPLRRIQNVDVSQRLPERLLGIAEVRLETAGGGSTEAKLRFVGVEEADRLQADISRLRRGAPRESTGEADDPTESRTAEPIFEITTRELAVLAVVSIDPRVLSIVALAGSILVPSMEMVGESPYVFGPEQILADLFGPLASLVLLVGFALGAGVLSATRFYDFTLTRDAEELRYERGLFQRYSGTIPLSKVQSLTVEENVLARALGYATLTIETAGYAPGSSGGEGSQSAVPLATKARTMMLADSIEDAGVESLNRPPKRARIRYVVRYTIVVAVLAGLLWAAGWAGVPFVAWYYALVVLPLVPVAAHLKWANLGYALGENHVVTQGGFWVRKRRVVPYHRVQTVVAAQTVFQRRRALATVTVDTAGSSSLLGGDAQAVDVDAETADSLRETVPHSLTAALAERRANGRTNGVDRRPNTQ